MGRIQMTTIMNDLKKSEDLKSDHFKIWKHLKSGLFEDRISNGLIFKGLIAMVSAIRKPDHSKSGCFFDKMLAICLEFKWLGFWFSDLISGPIANKPILNHLKS